MSNTIKKIRKVGDSYGILLPTRVVRDKLGADLSTPIRVIVDRGEIRLIPLERKPDLAAIEKITRDLIARYAKAIDLLAAR